MLRCMRLLLPGTLLLVVGLTSCTTDAKSADDVAKDLAGALSRDSVPDALFAGGSHQDEYDAITKGLGEVTPTVETGDVVTDEGSATATLRWAWDLDGYRWSYESAAELTDGDAGWEVEWSPALVVPDLTDGQTLTRSRIAPPRGDILGAGGRHLVTERPVVRIGIDKTQVAARRSAEAARRLAAAVDVSPGPFVRAVRAAGAQAFVEAIVLRRPDARALDPAYAAIPGAVALDDTLPLAPTRTFAAPILGRVGPVTAEVVEESDGRLAAGDVAGLSGLQARYDEQLAGTPGVRVSATGAGGGSRELFADGPVAGEPLRTTLVEELQRRAERVLAGGPTDGGASALVALRPSTGAVLAAASGPGADGQNVATFGQYAPGSTFKVVSSLALLRSGLTPDSRVGCPATTVVDGKTFKNYDDYPAARLGRDHAAAGRGQLVQHRLHRRCATGSTRVTWRTPPPRWASGSTTISGSRPTSARSRRRRRETEAAADLIGQGKVLASPLAMAAVAASVAAGETVVPRLLPAVDPSPGGADEPADPAGGGDAARPDARRGHRGLWRLPGRPSRHGRREDRDRRVRNPRPGRGPTHPRLDDRHPRATSPWRSSWRPVGPAPAPRGRSCGRS